METQYLNGTALKDLIHRLSVSNDPDAREDLGSVQDAMKSFHNYVDTVVEGEARLLFRGSGLEGQEYRDAVAQYDEDRHNAHEKAIGDAVLLNRLASRNGLPPVFTGDETQRHQIAEFCLETEQYFFRNRRMKLS